MTISDSMQWWQAIKGVCNGGMSPLLQYDDHIRCYIYVCIYLYLRDVLYKIVISDVQTGFL